MPPTEIYIDVDVECDQCRETLSATFNGGTLRVDPCKRCLNDSYNSGIIEGQDAGYQEGYDVAKAEEKGE